ncbi:hypothetical protein [Hyphomicrobium sp. NDB2Meth4]|uniref:hypothetical protein n=1 Tax=Hyphomicrobium sp. NDB2Meth4 TaxID=1892846 RepID=UPI000A406698|nr:hypothetical protein [Hyphomicrobium sp. NDB2Meth4]
MPARASATCAILGLGLVLLTMSSISAGAQERWAAIAPNLENSSTVVWATTKDQAKKLAVLACKQVSSTCAEQPASTNGMDHVFAVMCCTDPKTGCAAAVGSGRQQALKEVKRLFSEGGYSQCSLKSYFKAGTGEKG